MNNIVKKLFREHRLTETEYIELIKHYEETDLAKYLADEALRLRREIYGDAVYVRGLIEFTNICKNDCFYCGIRKSNPNAERYRLTKEEILDCCENGYHLGYRTFVLQGGEDGYYTDTRLSDIVRTIKDRFPDCAVTLSVGERSFESYRLLKEAGADRYLLRHETADAEHYRRLHPPELSWENRMRCLRDLKYLGYQVGAGFMVGSPYQTAECLAKDLVFLQEFRPEMVGIGPFIPHHDTQFADEPAGSAELTLFLLSVIRIMLPHVLLPATTALGTLSPVGRERGMLAGANVVMPNLSPVKNRKQYELYDNKICTGEEAAECRGCLENRMKSVGFRLVTDRGNYKP
ncbi:MAG: [FeFe] hydrogenase H-cluster radical SAM maturase HydE [Clostridiales bacterium]|nr:[FeFe] hydrogenase H-cluster radical SAM maturase HydE [Clostridiales bacterium]